MAKDQKLFNQSNQIVQAVLKRLGLETQIITLPEEAKTAIEAAKAVQCDLSQIAKSLIFKNQHDRKPVMVITSGVNRVNERKIANHLGAPIKMADTEFVRQKTGFAIGGVPPIGHPQPIKTFIDQDLLRHKQIWAAGGHPKTVFKLTPQELTRITQGQVIEVV